jgi:hypothetical protein
MAYKCPKCGEDVSRGVSNSAQQTAGLVGLLFSAAFGAFTCKKCGKIPRSDFASGIQAKMAMMSLALVVAAVGLAIGVLALLAKMD